MTEPTLRRVLITGLSSPAGAGVASRLEREPAVETIIGVDTAAPPLRLPRTEFARMEIEPTALAGVILGARIDTVVDTRLHCDPWAPPSAVNGTLAETRRLMEALQSPGSPVRKLVFCSSAHVYGFGAGAPAFLTEEMALTPPQSNGLQALAHAAEDLVARFARGHPHRTVTVLRCAEVVGPDARGAQAALLGLPAVPAMLGFDPRWQLLDQNDQAGALTHAVLRQVPGTYNVAADGVLVLSEIASLLDKSVLPAIPPLGTGLAMSALRRLGLPAPVELVQALRLGRGLDNRRFKAAGYVYRYTTREAVLRLRSRPPRLAGPAADTAATQLAKPADA